MSMFEGSTWSHEVCGAVRPAGGAPDWRTLLGGGATSAVELELSGGAGNDGGLPCVRDSLLVTVRKAARALLKAEASLDAVGGRQRDSFGILRLPEARVLLPQKPELLDGEGRRFFS